MISELARGDYEDLKAQGLNPTLDDFDRLNQLAIRLTDGAETTCANFPRIGWAGDVPFFEPTLAAFAWYHQYAVRAAANVETENTLWAFALAHGREPHFFAALKTPEEIDKAVSAWAESLPVTRDEVVRACRYAVRGFNDADPATNSTSPTPTHRASKDAAAENLRRVEEQLRAACAAMKCPPDALMGETQSRLAALCEAAAVELGRPMSKDETRLRADYDLTLREITLRLKAEKEKAESPKVNDDRRDNANGGEGIGEHVAACRTAPDPVAVGDGASDAKPEEVVVVVHVDGNNTKTVPGGQP